MSSTKDPAMRDALEASAKHCADCWRTVRHWANSRTQTIKKGYHSNIIAAKEEWRMGKRLNRNLGFYFISSSKMMALELEGRK